MNPALGQRIPKAPYHFYMTRIDDLINRISALQINSSSPFYEAGMFATQRTNKYLGYQREDSNIYYPAIIAFTLGRLRKYLTSDQSDKLRQIIHGVVLNFPLYRNKVHPELYNFYKINPVDHYPNGRILSKFRHFILPEDADDSCIISMVLKDMHLERQENIESLKNQLLIFSNGYRKHIKSAPQKYRDLKAYGMWFGSGRMPIEFDLCVTTNILCFVFENEFPLQEQDLDALEYVNMALQSKDVEHDPFAVSYTYAKPVVLLYHIARLFSVMPDPDKYLSRKDIIEQLQRQLKQADRKFVKIIAASALIRMGCQPAEIEYELDTLHDEFKSFGFFIAPLLKGTNNVILNAVAKWDVFHLLYDCEAYYYTLVLEYEILKQAMVSSEVKATASLEVL